MNIDFLAKTEYPFDFSTFTIYEEYCICKECGEKVDRGIGAIAFHWNKCAGSGYLQELMKLKEDKKDEITVEDIEKLNESFFKK